MRIDNYNLNLYSQYKNFQSETFAGNAFSKTSSKKLTQEELQSFNSTPADTDVSNANSAAVQRINATAARWATGEMATLLGNGMRSQVTVGSQEVSEAIGVQARGIIKADGKELHIDLTASMGRSFTSSFVSNSNFYLKQVVDPLVISLDGAMPSIGNKSFEFDLDSDGKSDQISTLRAGAAFLALDRNENGKIDDGGELFGVKSGDGFTDLSLFDSDGNGWIDENDPIFDKLRVWQKSDVGDKLVAIGEVGIGAIFLGSVESEFGILSHGRELAQLRRSGIVLFNDGRSSVVAQMDMIKYETSDDESVVGKKFNPQDWQFTSKKTSKITHSNSLKMLNEHLVRLQNELKNTDKDKDEEKFSKLAAQINMVHSQILMVTNLAKEIA